MENFNDLVDSFLKVAKGEKGDPGEKGERGEPGKQGEKGNTGIGLRGLKGDTFTYGDMSKEDKADLVDISSGQWNQPFAEKYDKLEREYAEDLTFTKTQLAQKATLSALNITNQTLASKADKSELQQINLSFKESYGTWADLTTKYPTGDVHNHVVLADGFIYTWNTSLATPAWSSTGIQGVGTGLADGTVTVSKLATETTNYFDNKIGNKADKLVVTNMMLDSNFIDTTKWGFYLATGNIANNEAIFTPTAQYGVCRQNQIATSKMGHKYYISANVKATSPLVQLQLIKYAGSVVIGTPVTHSGDGLYNKLSGIMVAEDESVMSLRVIDYRSSGWDSVSVKEFMLTDLTTEYGVGNEPSLAEYEEMLANKNNGSSFVENSLTTSLIVGEPTINPPMDKSVFPIYVDKTGDVINVISRYSATQDLRVNLAPKGVNNIFNIYDLFKIENLTSKLSNDIALGISMNGATTDWLGPYVVWAEENRDGDMPTSYGFTGGNHGYDGGATGSATGRTTDIQLFVDGKKYDSYSDYAHFIDIYWSNRVQSTVTKKADGTGREVLQENYHAHFDGYKWTIECNIEALEKITIITYYGIQASIPSWNGFVFYHNSPTNRLWNDATIASTSGNKTTNRATLKKGTDYLEVAIDNTVGIGDRALLATGDGCFVSDTKVYFNLIKTSTFLKGQVLSYAGHYRFYSK